MHERGRFTVVYFEWFAFHVFAEEVADFGGGHRSVPLAPTCHSFFNTFRADAEFRDLTTPSIAEWSRFGHFTDMTLPRPSCWAFVMAKVFQGLLMVKADHADTQDKILRLWCHEESRVFRDRLISAEDRTWFNNALQVQVAQLKNSHKVHVLPPVALFGAQDSLLG